MHTYTYIHTNIHIHIYTHKYICTHTYIHIYIYTYIHIYTYTKTKMHTYTHKMDRVKMADDVNQQAQNSLNMIVKLTNESGNLKKELRKLIHENVSTLRNLIYRIKDNMKEKIK